MKALDTNVLVRFLVQDDKVQTALAVACIARYAASPQPLFVNSIVLCELVWVLESCYDYSHVQISNVLDKLLRTHELFIPDKEIIWGALRAYQSSKADFADALIGQINKNAGYQTVTFDKTAALLPEFELLR